MSNPNKKNSNYRSFLSLGLAFILIFSTIITYHIFANPSEEIKKLEREYAKLQEQIKSVNQQIKQNKNLQSETLKKIDQTNYEIEQIESEITVLKEKISSVESQILTKEAEIDELNTKLEEKTDLLMERLRAMYKAGTVGFAEVLVGADDFSDLLTRIDMVQRIVKHDQDLIVSITELRQDLEIKKLALEEQKNTLTTLFKESVAKQENLRSKVNSLYAYQNTLKQDEQALEELEDEQLKQANQLTEEIKNWKLALTYVGGVMAWPVPGQYSISSPFGTRVHPVTRRQHTHTGIDVPAPTGTNIIAANSGTVVYADWFGSYGKCIILDHGGGIVTLYAHLSSIGVRSGVTVVKGQTIGEIGSTGVSTGPHLHFEVRVDGKYVQPLDYVKGH